MSATFDRAAMLLVAVVFVASSFYALSGAGGPMTKEEAIAMSRRSSYVRRLLSESSRFSVYATYYNSSEVERLEAHIDSFKLVTDGHSVWEVYWTFRHLWGHYSITHGVVVDAETGEIIADRLGIILLSGEP